MLQKVEQMTPQRGFYPNPFRLDTPLFVYPKPDTQARCPSLSLDPYKYCGQNPYTYAFSSYNQRYIFQLRPFLHSSHRSHEATW